MAITPLPGRISSTFPRNRNASSLGISPSMTSARKWRQSNNSTAVSRKAAWLASIFLLLSFIPSAQLAWRSRDMPHLSAMNDDGIYMVCAKSLAEGAGYRILSLPKEPFETKYPPLYPWVLSLLWRINPDFPSNLHLFTFFSWALLPASTALAWVLYREMGLGFVHRTILCAVIALSPNMALLGILLLSDLTFCCFLFLALILAERAAKPESRLWMAFAAGMIAGVAYLTKSAAIAFLVSAPLCYAIRKQYQRALAFAAGMTPFVLLWSLWARLHILHGTDLVTLYYTDYVGMYFYDLHWADLALLLSSNTVTIVNAISGLFIYTESFPVWLNLLSFVLALACISGTIRLAKRFDILHYPVFACLFAMTLVAWNYPPTARFVVPLFPLIAAGLAIELDHLRGMIVATLKRPGIAERSVALVLSAAICLFFCFVAVRARLKLYDHFPGWVEGYRTLLMESRLAYDWIDRKTPSNATFLADRDTFLYLHTGRHASGQPRSSNLYYRGNLQEFLMPPLDRTASFSRGQGHSYYYVENNVPTGVTNSPEFQQFIRRREYPFTRFGNPPDS